MFCYKISRVCAFPGVKEADRLKGILKIAFLMALIIGITFSLVLLLKLFGINGGWATRIIPFGAIISLTLIFSFKIDKIGTKDLGSELPKGNMAVVALIYISVMKDIAEVSELPKGNMAVVAALLCLSAAPAIIGLIFYGRIEFKEVIDGEIGVYALYYILVAFSEELLFRGYIRKTMEGSNDKLIYAVSALAFAGFHFISPEFNLITFALLYIFGVIFMYMYMYMYMRIKDLPAF